MYYCWDVFVLDCGDFTDMGSYKLCSLQSDVSTFQILSGSIMVTFKYICILIEEKLLRTVDFWITVQFNTIKLLLRKGKYDF